ncbi:MAG: molybdopterin-dependent oxidoreductase [Dehalococcoidia bacterium]|nr:molybdopterin-dependent oxidoreductase [Dehalococcoidia bacterium]
MTKGSEVKEQEVPGPDRSGQPGDIIRYTTCDNACFNQCILKVRIRGGIIVACEPDDTVNPGMPREDAHLPRDIIDKGMVQNRACAKGYAQAMMIYDPARLKYPMKRAGRRGEAKFERISWDEALDTIANKLVETKKNYGPFSIIHQPYSNYGVSSLPIAPWFGAGVAGWASHSSNGSEEPWNWVLGKDHGKTYSTRGGFDLTQDEANVFKSRLIVLWGQNPLTSLNGGWAYNLLRAREQGIPIVCIEPRYTASVEMLADQWIPIRPTTDVAMMIAMANVWFKEDLCDKEFVDKWVEPEGLKRWKAYVLGKSDGVDKTPEWAETICGVPTETIAGFARLYARSKPVNLNVSQTLGRQFYGENPARASMYLQALTGNTCIPGGTSAAETGNFLGQAFIPIPAVDWQRKPATYKPPTLMAMYKWPLAVNMREQLDRGEVTKEHYDEMIGNMPGQASPNIQMVILEGCNHTNNLPDMNSTIRALKKVDFVVVFSQYAENPAARYADIVLPQMYNAFEGRNCQRGGGSLFKPGKNLANFFVYCQKCSDPPGEVKPGTWVWTQIARRLGVADMYNPRMAQVTDDKWDESIEQLHKEAYNKWAARGDVLPMNPPNWEDFQKKPVVRYEIKEPNHAFKRDIEKGENPFKGTLSGKIEFYSEGLAKGPAYLATNEFVPGTGRCYGGGNLPAMAQMSFGGWDTFHSADSERYPLLMSSPHSLYRVHSFLDNNPWLRGDCYRHAVWINVADAEARRIADDDLVMVYNDIGEMIIPAYVTSRIIPGTVCVFHGSWYNPSAEKNPLMPDGVDRGGAPNFLTHNRDLPETIIGNFPCKGLVQVRKWEDS